jgi:SAM-dependent methyltransferase
MKKNPYYGFPVSSIIIRAIFLIFIILVIIEIIFLEMPFYIIFFLSFFSLLIHSYFGIILFKKSFQNYRIFILRKMIEVSNLRGDEKILDIGTGAGIIAIGFAKYIKDGKVYGIDIYNHKYNSFKDFFISKIKINFFGNNLKNAKRNAKIEKVENKCDFFSADFTKVHDFPDNSFDIILSSQSLYCVNIKNNTNILKDIDRILKKNGKIVFFEPISFFRWKIIYLKNFFEEIGYIINILKNGDYKRHCILVGKKLK